MRQSILLRCTAVSFHNSAHLLTTRQYSIPSHRHLRVHVRRSLQRLGEPADRRRIEKRRDGGELSAEGRLSEQARGVLCPSGEVLCPPITCAAVASESVPLAWCIVHGVLLRWQDAGVLHVACCTLYVACCMLCVVCRMVHVAGVVDVACRMVHVAGVLDVA